MALSILGWLNGISSLGVVSFGLIFGIYFIIISRKTEAKLLFFLGLYGISIAMVWSGVTIDFLNIILTGQNLGSPIIDRIIWSLTPFWGVMAISIAVKLLIPNKKWYIWSVLLVFSTLYILILNFDLDGQLIVEYPALPGGDVILAYLTPFSFCFFLALILLGATIIFNSLGYSLKTIKSEEKVRRRYLILAVGNFLVNISVAIEGLLKRSFILVITRIILITGFLIIFMGLKEITDKPVKKPKKDTKIKDSLFRVSKRPDNLTEEEVSVSKEKKICLVCKGNVAGFNNFICPECGTFYCAKCAKALSDLENICWVCEKPLDPSKPMRLIHDNEQQFEIKVLKDFPKTIKNHEDSSNKKT